MSIQLRGFSIDRAIRAVEKVRQRLLKVAAALDAAGIPYAVAGGNAVALWVSRVDESAVRSTQDVDILIRRDDLSRVRAVLETAGFQYRDSGGMDIFLDGDRAKLRDAVHLVFANEKVREAELLSNPDVSDSEATEQFRVLSLRAIVQIKLTAFRDKDRVHLRDLIEVGLVDESWISALPAELGKRLQELLDTPNG